jgi:hypothetical protein
MLGLASLDVFMRLIWQASLVLVAIGLTLMTALVLRRLLEEWRDERHRPARDRLRKSLLGSLNQPAEPTGAPIETSRDLGLPVAEIARLVDELAQIVRGDARLRLAAFAASAGVEQLWLRRLGSRLPRFRIEAARCLTLLRTPRTQAALHAALAHSDSRLRLAAAEALADDPERADAIADRLLADPAGQGRHAKRFWHRLAMVAPMVLVERLTEADVAPASLVRLVDALGDAGHVAAGGKLEGLVGRHGALVDRASLRALDRLNHPAVMRVAGRLAESGQLESRRAAIDVLSVRARVKDLELLRSLATDPVTEIADAARTIHERLAALAVTGASPA